MGKFELKLPEMGEGVEEATITSWTKKIGENISEGEIIVEVATDKVDNELSSETSGVIISQNFKPNETASVGDVIAVIETSSNTSKPEITEPVQKGESKKEISPTPLPPIPKISSPTKVESKKENFSKETSQIKKFYSPLIRSMAKEEGISLESLNHIKGSGKNNRITKVDFENYLNHLKEGKIRTPIKKDTVKFTPTTNTETTAKILVSSNSYDQVIPMGRVRKLIADHMVNSIQTSAHVQTFIEADVTNLVKWRNKIKDEFQQKEGTKLTFTPIFIKIIAKALRDYPMINSCIDGDHIIMKSNLNIGMATALPDGNLIVPVIENANNLSLSGLARKVNDLANRARNNSLKTEETKNGTFTFTNIGSFGSLMGTPIINQPQSAILALGAIQKVPAVMESDDYDYITIRHKMYLSHSYDHRIIDGALGGLFVKRVAEYLEHWNINRTI